MALKRQTGLGRGLNAIFDMDEVTNSTTPTQNVDVMSAVTELELSKIDPNPDQPRSNFDATSIEELAQSIASVGIIQPLTVRESDYGRYVIISGERRYKAARKAGLTTVPVYVRKVNDQKLLEMALVENIQREDLNPLEIAITLDRLITECKITQEVLSERVGKNRATISNYIRLLKLPSSVQVALARNEISMGHAKALLSVDSDEFQEMMLTAIIKDALSVRQTEQAIKQFIQKGEDVKEEKKVSELPQNIKHFENQLKSFFGTKVSITRTPKGESKVTISFRNDSEIEEILNKLK